MSAEGKGPRNHPSTSLSGGNCFPVDQGEKSFVTRLPSHNDRNVIIVIGSKISALVDFEN